MAAVPQLVERSITGEQLRAVLKISDEEIYWLKHWGTADRKVMSSSETMAPAIIEAIQLTGDLEVTDFGCGNGRFGFDLWQMGYDVTLIDIAENCLDEIVTDKLPTDGLCFKPGDITKLKFHHTRVGVCIDVLHTISPEKLDSALQFLVESCENIILSVRTDKADGHLTVKDYQWWLRKFIDYKCDIHRTIKGHNSAIFFVSGKADFFLNNFCPNTDDEQLEKNLRKNANHKLQQFMAYEPQDIPAMLIAGGPSLNDFEDEIIKRRAQGAKLLTVNGAYNWAIERGMKPSAQFVLDARAFNKRFVLPVVDDCRYVIGSAACPEIFDALPKDRTYYWNVYTQDALRPVYEELFGETYKDWMPIVGGSTVMLRALYSAKLMGLGITQPLTVYGFDSCTRAEQHHAYDQPENNPQEGKSDAQTILRVVLNRGKDNEARFDCQLWMLAQAKEFAMLHKTVFRDLKLDVKGPGLISYILATDAEIEE